MRKVTREIFSGSSQTYTNKSDDIGLAQARILYEEMIRREKKNGNTINKSITSYIPHEQKRNSFRVKYSNVIFIYQFTTQLGEIGKGHDHLVEANIRDISDGGISIFTNKGLEAETGSRVSKYREDINLSTNEDVILHFAFDKNDVYLVATVRYVGDKFIGLSYKQVISLSPDSVNPEKEFYRRMSRFIFSLQKKDPRSKRPQETSLKNNVSTFQSNPLRPKRERNTYSTY